MNFQDAQAAFEGIMSSITAPDTKEKFLQWIYRSYLDGMSPDDMMDCQSALDSKLIKIIDDLRRNLPADAIVPSESVRARGNGDAGTYDLSHTIHVDAFLYDENAVDDLCNDGLLQRYYCKDCDSRNVEPLTFISHSISRERLSFIFQSLLPDLKGMTVVDVGSRIGAVLYGAYVYSRADVIIGVELNQELCILQNQIIDKYHMGKRIKVLCGDIKSFPEVVQQADVIFLHNVFEFFLPPEEQVKCWHFLQKNVRKKGTWIVAVPGIEEATQNLDVNLDIKSWLNEIPVDETIFTLLQDQPELTDIKLYRVL